MARINGVVVCHVHLNSRVAEFQIDDVPAPVSVGMPDVLRDGGQHPRSSSVARLPSQVGAPALIATLELLNPSQIN